jgi:hypothetical protein
MTKPGVISEWSVNGILAHLVDNECFYAIHEVYSLHHSPQVEIQIMTS